MKEYRLPAHFWEEHAFTEFSSPNFIQERLDAWGMGEIWEQAEALEPFLDPSMKEAYQKEAERIAAIQTGEDVVACMRKTVSPLNQTELINKALTMQEAVMPLVLKRLLTSGQDHFIEGAALLYGLAEDQYVEQAYAAYGQIRSPYARSLICTILGFKKKVEYTDFLLEQYEKLSKIPSEDSLEQGPLMGLDLIYEGQEVVRAE